MGVNIYINKVVGVIDWFASLFINIINFLVAILMFFLLYPLLAFAVFVMVYLIIKKGKIIKEKTKRKDEKEIEEGTSPPEF